MPTAEEIDEAINRIIVKSDWVSADLIPNFLDRRGLRFTKEEATKNYRQEEVPAKYYFFRDQVVDKLLDMRLALGVESEEDTYADTSPQG